MQSPSTKTVVLVWCHKKGLRLTMFGCIDVGQLVSANHVVFNATSNQTVKSNNNRPSEYVKFFSKFI